MAKIKLNDPITEIFHKLSEGNPGALNVLCAIWKAPEIDPDAMLGALSSILDLDTLELYGPNIWILYKDICGQSIPKTVATLRAWQLGFISKSQIHVAINNHQKIDVDSLYSQVKERLPNFNPVPQG